MKRKDWGANVVRGKFRTKVRPPTTERSASGKDAQENTQEYAENHRQTGNNGAC